MLHFFSDLDLTLLYAAINMAVALILGAIIGAERQFRGRMAGLRTNALVSLGAAGFVVFAALFPDDINPTRVAAQVVSGIGFLGAGIIFRDGFNIQGINTAATLWCSAAVGLIAGSGHLPYAIVLAALIVFANLGLRPIVRRLKRLASQSEAAEAGFVLTFACKPQDEADIRAALITALTEADVTLSQILSHEGKNTIDIIAQVGGHEDTAPKIEQIIARMSLSPGLLRAAWSVSEDTEIKTP